MATGGSELHASVPGKPTGAYAEGDSSESEGETEPAKSFHRRISTNKEIKCSVSIKEGFLMKQTSSFQRWRKRYFKLKGHKLYYAKDTKSVIFDEIHLTDLSVAECSTKNINHSFQCITPFRSLVLAAETRREMEEWITALKSANTTTHYYEGADQVHSLLSGQHNWYATSHARPTYCNVCREALSGVTSHGLSCEVCKLKAHKRCAAKALNNCKWTTLASVGKDIIEDEEGILAMPHQWVEGNLPVSAKCAVCEKTCGSVLRLQDWRCLWCRAMVHTACRPLHPTRCPLGPCRVSIVPPTALTTIGTDESWEATRPQGCSPLLVFVNSKSGDNQGVRFLRRFKQLLNPAQVFDLMNGGPVLGLRLFKCFNPFRILICSGDGSVGWVLSEIDQLHMTNQCQIGVLPLGTGNDLARVLGWGSACDDDTHLPHILEKYERATTKMLDRWSIMSYVSHVSLSPEHKLESFTSHSLLSQVAAYEDSVGAHLATLLQSNQHSVVISSAKVLCETIKSLIMKVGRSWGEGSHTTESTDTQVIEDSLSAKCAVLNDKLDLLLRALHEESIASVSSASSATPESSSVVDESPETSEDLDTVDKGSLCKENKNASNIQHRKRTKRKCFIERDALMSRANSLKKAVREIIEHTEKAVDDQNAQTATRLPPPTITLEASEDMGEEKVRKQIMSCSGLQVLPTIEGSSAEVSPCPSPTPMAAIPPFVSSITTNFPLPPASPLPGTSSSHAKYSISIPSHQIDSSSSTFLQIPGTISLPVSSNVDDPSDQLSVNYQAISPLPDIRRESHGEFEFPPTLPVPREFADLSRKNSMQENRDAAGDRCPIPIEDIEVRIQSSTDNLVDVGEDEPYTFEEKSITEIRDSLANSLNNSIDIDEEWAQAEEEEANKEDNVDEEKVCIKEEAEESEGEEDKEKTETLDSDETDETVKETHKYEAKDDDEDDDGVADDTTPEGDTSVIEDIVTDDKDGVNFVSRYEWEGSLPHREEPTGEESHDDIHTPDVPLAQEEISESIDKELEVELMPPPSERIVEGAEAGTEDEEEEKASRRISSGSTLKNQGGRISTLSVASSTSGRDKSRSPERGGRGSGSRGLARGSAAARSSRKHLPIINPLVSLPMWPNIAAGASSGGLISKVLLANADALCAAASPLMDLDDSSLEGYDERCTMNNYFGIGIDAKITLDFHNKREEHPEKCRSRTKNFMWYGVLASKEWLCKTYKNLDQRVQLECDGERIPLPSLQGIVVLNIPSFMGGTNFWGGTKEDDCFLAPSFDDRILEVVAVFGSAQMAASRIINLQHHRIAQCSSIKITILGEAGEEGVPIQVDGEAWTQPPGIVRIVHKNRVQMLCRSRDLEVSLKAWEEKQRSSGSQTEQLTLLADEELPVLASLASTVADIISCVRMAAVNTPSVENLLGELASSATTCLEKIWRDGRIIESPNLRMLATELVNNVRNLHTEVSSMLKDESLEINKAMEENLQGPLAHLDNVLKYAHEKDSVMHFVADDEGDRKRVHSKGIFKLKLKREGRRGGFEREVREWGPEEVGVWLDTLQLTEYQESFIRHDIRGSELLNLERRDLKELGITKIGHIKRIQQGIREIKESKSHG
ncbi:diacylglycerol kinase eta-like isoform X2 [Homarus americanus]|uniref:diacylglycerol kinase eta-like isoform X2 n=1 Tax=Homarus americanus TaxID=6706 RepID=UPI001C444353|nr:diacylglycerol kinase eta-like isoform X2 [Homarus americanus]